MKARLGSTLDRGATLVEYALAIALVVVVSIGAIGYLTDETAEEIDDRSRRTGAPDVDQVPTSLPVADPGDEIPPDAEDGDTPGYTGEVRVSTPETCWEATAAEGNGNPHEWTAQMTFTVSEQSPAGAGIQGAEVRVAVRLATGKNDAGPESWEWEPDKEGDIIVLTDASGYVSITRTDLKGNGNPQVYSVEFEVVSITGAGLTYSPSEPLTARITKSSSQECA